MKAAGLDGLELEAYGHLLDQFWSPLTNELDGDYGGSLDNRMRFSLQVLSAIRARVGSDFLIGIRYVSDEVLEGGLTKMMALRYRANSQRAGSLTFSMSFAGISRPMPD